MKEALAAIISNAWNNAVNAGELTCPLASPVLLDEPRQEAHGDFATNLAMTMAREEKKAPKKIAAAILDHIEDPENILARSEIAGPGFINFFIRPEGWRKVLSVVHGRDSLYGSSNIGRGEKVMVEFVSANPTGPLHVGHGRGAAVGDCLASLLAFTGHDVTREYYINDSGRQIRTLGLSVWLRMQEEKGESIDFPEDAYQGPYIRDIARRISKEHGAELAALPREEAVALCARKAARIILDGIRADLKNFGVIHDNWFSEQSLYDSGFVDKTLGDMKARSLIYELDGAWWFKSSSYGDEKDRVVVRQNGLNTYFAADIAYHAEKFSRGFNRVIDVWGADHHGYVDRVTAAVEAVGKPKESFRAVLVTLVNLLRAGSPVAMSTRSGEFITLSEVVDEVGADAARFIFLTRHHESPLDFDLELAKQKSSDNPVYYVQYVHARISSIEKKAAEAGLAADPEAASLLEPEELKLLKKLNLFPEAVGEAARLLEPHRITYYLLELASLFHPYYNRHRVISEDTGLSQARLALVAAIRKVIRNGLGLLGVNAPETM